MSLFSAIFGSRPKSASVAKDRLQLIIARERSERGGVDWLPRLRAEITAFRRSTSWRVTAPIRSMVGRFRGA